MLSCLLIKALICLAEGKEAGMCGDIISKLKAMASELSLHTALPKCVTHFIFIFILHKSQNQTICHLQRASIRA